MICQHCKTETDLVTSGGYEGCEDCVCDLLEADQEEYQAMMFEFEERLYQERLRAEEEHDAELYAGWYSL